jgi:ABC-type transport system substrate-binding protein
VRRALAYGIDRVEIARAFLGKDARPLDSSVFLPSEPEYRPNWRHYRYDPARSRSLLRQAGCVPAADGVYSCAGKPMRLDFVTTAGNPLRARVLELVRDQLAAVGVEVIPRFVQFGALFDQVLPSGAFDVALFGWLTNGGGGVRPESVCGHAQNWTGRCSRLLTRDARQVDVVLDEDERTKVLQAVDVKQSRSVTALPLVQPVMRAAIRTDLRGFVAGSDQFHFEENSEDWWLARGG